MGYLKNPKFKTQITLSDHDYLLLKISQLTKCFFNCQIGFKFRERGTELWGTVEKTPGPGAYDHNKFYNTSKFNNTTKFSVPQAKHGLNFNIGPYATL